jgi:hydroxymethylglutaryl-CoA lyase
MADAEEVMKRVPKRDDIRYAGLVLSRSGLERALKTEANCLHVVVTASDTFNLRNARRTVDEAVQELCQVIKEGIASNRGVTGVIGTAFGCPYEGKVPISRVLKVAESFLNAGCTEITLADTTGMATPRQVEETVH